MQSESVFLVRNPTDQSFFYPLIFVALMIGWALNFIDIIAFVRFEATQSLCLPDSTERILPFIFRQETTVRIYKIVFLKCRKWVRVLGFRMCHRIGILLQVPFTGIINSVKY